MNQFIIAPSLLSANFAKLGEEAEAVIKAGADWLHLDVMDNHYVPNLTVGPLVCNALRRYGIKAPIDVHLMVKPVDKLIVEFAEAGASHITFHPEASLHIDRSLDLIKKYNIKAGLAFNPATSLHCLEYLLEKIDIILLMSVNPGFAGQAFIPKVLNKIKKVKEMVTANHLNTQIAVDGGIKLDNILEVAKAGANAFIAGSAIYNQADYAVIINQMRDELKGV